jgi:hypothetical protein
MSVNDKNVIMVVAADPGTVRGRMPPTKLNVDELSVNVSLFLEQMGSVLDKAPESLGSLQFVEFEVSAEISAKGTLSLLGSGGEAGATGGIKFVFRRAPTKTD